MIILTIQILRIIFVIKNNGNNSDYELAAK